MKITIAQTAGFCMGVHRAVDLAVEISAKSDTNIYSLGPLIHNKPTLDMLEERGVETINETDKPRKNSTVIIRAHGVSPETEAQVNGHDCNIIDGTCPKVKTVHKVIAKYKNSGFDIVITGDKGHAEVIGLMGYAGEKGHLISTLDEVDKLGDFKKVCLVSQTTFSRTLFDEIQLEIEDKYNTGEVTVRKTICAATDKRQLETTEIAKTVDALIVVGGKNSANTVRLAEISKKSNTPTFHIESEDEINWKDISKFEHIGITAGASTPNWMIKRVADHVAFLDRTNRKTLFHTLSGIFDVLAHTNIFVAAGGASMYYASCVLQGVKFTFTGAALSFLYMMSIYLWNSLTSIESSKHLDLGRYRFYSQFKTLLSILALSSFGIILTVSLLQDHNLFYLTLLLTAAGSAYQFTIVPSFLKRFVKYRNLKDIPASRELFAALAWSVLTTFIPHAAARTYQFTPATIAFFIWTFFLVYFRSIIFDLRDIEGDRIMGRETLITVIGEKRASKLLTTGITVSLIGMLFYSLLIFVPSFLNVNLSPIVILFQLPVVLHLALFMKWQHKLTKNLSPLFNLFVDGQFYIAALGACLASIFLR